jgi:hypothetical protein
MLTRTELLVSSGSEQERFNNYIPNEITFDVDSTLRASTMNFPLEYRDILEKFLKDLEDDNSVTSDFSDDSSIEDSSENPFSDEDSCDQESQKAVAIDCFYGFGENDSVELVSHRLTRRRSLSKVLVEREEQQILERDQLGFIATKSARHYEATGSGGDDDNDVVIIQHHQEEEEENPFLCTCEIDFVVPLKQ